MTRSFVAYIDESGDEGFVFRDDGTGSSRWLVLSAIVARNVAEPSLVGALKRARQTLGWEAKRAFHFRDMKHEARLVLLHEAVQLGFRTVTVASYKPDIRDPERFQANKYVLYRYLTRLLVERISWLCRDELRPGEGDGIVDLIFSDRAAMSYDDIRSYFSILRNQSDVKIHWPAIRQDRLQAVAHHQLAGLQLADAVATSYMYAMRLSRYGVSDHSYVALLRGHAYRHKAKVFGYGLKFLSPWEGLKEKMPHLGAAFRDW